MDQASGCCCHKSSLELTGLELTGLDQSRSVQPMVKLVECWNRLKAGDGLGLGSGAF